jgi:hypothetical protein
VVPRGFGLVPIVGAGFFVAKEEGKRQKVKVIKAIFTFYLLLFAFPRGGDQPWTAMALLILESFATTDLPE